MRSILCFTFLSLLAVTLPAQDITGSWLGNLNAGQSELRLIFNFEAGENGYTGTLDSPDQGVRGIPFAEVDFDGSHISVTIPQMGVTYTGTLIPDGTAIEGIFKQGLYELKLNMERGAIVIKRPQEPQPPYPYRSREVKFDNPTDGVTLAGTLTLPAETGVYPAVIMVTGSGPQNRDEEILDHKPFLVISDYLTRRGIAVLRYDDRGVAESTGSFSGSTTEDFTRDALAAFDFLRGQDEIDPTRVGVIGHSEGGTIAFMMAAREPELGFVVSMAGGLLPGDSTLVLQNRDMLVLSGLDPGLVDSYVTALGEVFRIKNNNDKECIFENMDSFIAGITGFEELPENMQQNLVSLMETYEPWFDFFIKYDPTEDIAKTLCPVLAINGEKDVQVAADANLSHVAQILRQAGNERFTTKIYPGRNHMFQDCDTGAFEEYNRIEQTISPQVLEDIAEWILDINR